MPFSSFSNNINYLTKIHTKIYTFIVQPLKFESQYFLLQSLILYLKLSEDLITPENIDWFLEYKNMFLYSHMIFYDLYFSSSHDYRYLADDFTPKYKKYYS